MLKIPLAALAIGGKVFVPLSDIPDKAKLRTAIYSVGKANNTKYKTRMTKNEGILGMQIERIEINSVDFGFEDEGDEDYEGDYPEEEEEGEEYSDEEPEDPDETPVLDDLGLFKTFDWMPSYCFYCKKWGPDLRRAVSVGHAVLMCLKHIEECKGIGSMVTLKEMYLVIDPIIRAYPDNTNMKDKIRDSLSTIHRDNKWIFKKKRPDDKDIDGKYYLTDSGRDYQPKE